MKKLLLIITLGLLTACGPKPIAKYVDAELQPFVDQFIKEAYLHGASLDSKRFGNMSVDFSSEVTGDTLGICRVSTAGLKVMINPVQWAAASIESKEQVIFHELGHCILGRDHDNRITTFYRRGFPQDRYFTTGNASLMNQLAMWPEDYAKNRIYYVKQLFYPAHTETLYWDNASQFDMSTYSH